MLSTGKRAMDWFVSQLQSQERTLHILDKIAELSVKCETLMKKSKMAEELYPNRDIYSCIREDNAKHYVFTEIQCIW